MLKNLKISTRLRLMAGLPLVFLLAISVFAWWGLRLGTEALKTVQKDGESAILLSTIVTDMYRIRALLGNAIVVDDQEERARSIKNSDERMTEIMKNWNVFIDTPMSANEKELAGKIGKDLDKMLDGYAQPIMVALRRGDKEAATQLVMSSEGRDVIARVRD